MVKVKLCGMTSLDDCLAAADLGVDFVGFVFFRKSARYVEPRKVREITERLDGTMKTVGVFVEETEGEMKEMTAACGLDYAQVYRPVTLANRISVLRVRGQVPEAAMEGMVLFDSYTDGFGGSGVSFDFDLVKGHRALGRAFIAGGLNEGNLERALSLNPYGIDLVSSVEDYKGKKNRTKMKSLMKKVRSFNL